MAKKKQGCLIGCGVGCLILLVLGIALFAGGAVWFRNLAGGFEQAVEARAALEEELGQPEDFVPPPDGSIPPERVEAFLTVRAATAEGRDGIRDFFEAIPLTEEEAQALDDQPFLEKMGSVVGITSSALAFAGSLGEFYNARNAALIEHRMGLGEYTYIYVLAYYNFLGNSPDDGPGEDESMHDTDFERSFARARRGLIQNLENQLAQLPGGVAEAEPGGVEAEPGGTGSSVPPARLALEREIAAMRDERWRVPWEDGLPRPIEASLAPYRSRLEAAYDPVTNPFELARMEQQGHFSFKAD